MKNRIVLLIRSKPFIAAVLFLTGLIIFESLFFSQAYPDIVLSRHFRNAVYLKVFVLIFLTTTSIVLTGFFLWAAFASPYKYRIVYFALFCFAVAVEYGYQNAFRHFTTGEDFENAVFAADWHIQSNAAGIYFNYLAVVPCVIFGVLLYFQRS